MHLKIAEHVLWLSKEKNCAIILMNNKGEFFMRRTFTLQMVKVIYFLLVSTLSIIGNSKLAIAYGIVPDDLSVGDTYHLIFVTDGTIQSSSRNISFYDSFITEQANAEGSFYQNLDVDWRAIGSTDVLWAQGHAYPGYDSPVYMVTSLADSPVRIENNTYGLWGGPDSQRIFAPINRTQFGDAYNGHVWTGSYQGGDPVRNAHLGAGNTIWGYTGTTSTVWIYGSVQPGSDYLPMYGISSQLTVSPVPIPGAVWLLGSGIVGLVGLRKKYLQ